MSTGNDRSLSKNGLEGDSLRIRSESRGGDERRIDERNVGSKIAAVEIAGCAEMTEGSVSDIAVSPATGMEGPIERSRLRIHGSVFASLNSVSQDQVVVRL